ncbi:hypothetical protein RB213_003896 [Colletotrichum asianum]
MLALLIEVFIEGIINKTPSRRNPSTLWLGITPVIDLCGRRFEVLASRPCVLCAEFKVPHGATD